jgi:membrane-anchored protein YejM (alkaline phosphatase superfamily)
MSMHGPYDYGPENKLLFEQLGYFDMIDQAEENGEWINILHEGATVDQWRIRHYQAAVMDFDVALGKLFNALIERDLLDNTILVLYGDHNVYYHDLNLMINNTDASEYFNMDMYQTFFAIYNPSLTAIYKEYNETNVIDKFVSPYNIVPTLLDLLGKSYNQHLFLGESVFTDRHEVFYSNKLTAFFDINIFSNDGYDIVYLKEEQDQDYLDGFFATCEENRLRLEIINHWFDSTKKIRE